MHFELVPEAWHWEKRSSRMASNSMPENENGALHAIVVVG
jgi:hypothetical protein